MASEPHRKRVRHFNVPGHAHLLTFSCYRRMALLTNDLWRAWLSTSIDRALARYGVDLIAFVYMPEHIHLLVFPRPDVYDISRVLYAIKRPFSFRIKQHLEEQKSALLRKLTVRTRPDTLAFRFWQEGGGHDRNLISTENCVKAAEYIHNNLVRKGLVSTADRWRWSSWRFYHDRNWKPDATLPRIQGFPG